MKFLLLSIDIVSRPSILWLAKQLARHKINRLLGKQSKTRNLLGTMATESVSQLICTLSLLWVVILDVSVFNIVALYIMVYSQSMSPSPPDSWHPVSHYCT
jgi:hypothetical protein